MKNKLKFNFLLNFHFELVDLVFNTLFFQLFSYFISEIEALHFFEKIFESNFI